MHGGHDIKNFCFCVILFHRKAVKGSGGKVSPMKKGDAGRDPVKTDKQPLVETLPKPE